jgi:hypothetical protein
MICLPPDWPLEIVSQKDVRHYWPIYLLKMLARFPHQFNTWLWCGHTMPNGDPVEPYADNTQLCCALLMSPVRFDPKFSELNCTAPRSVY